VPAKELETDGLPVYTFGGVGKEQMTGVTLPSTVDAATSRLFSMGATQEMELPNGQVVTLHSGLKYGTPRKYSLIKQ
jgi:hypothetical protein